MGMFDYISFEDPLPDFPVKVITSGGACPQTKSFDFPAMDTYIVRDHKLYRHVKVYVGTGKFEQWRAGKYDLGTREVMEIDSEYDVQVLYHGDLDLSCTTEDDQYVRLVARFTDGVLQWIKKEEDVTYERRD
jgi:hypothetical protein